MASVDRPLLSIPFNFTDFSSSGFSEQDNKTSDTIKGREILDCMKKNSVQAAPINFKLAAM